MSENPVDTLEVDEFTLGLVGPEQEWAGTVRDGGTIKTHTPAGCWEPMITPSFRGGHEVTRPIHVENAEPGDALVVRIKDIEVTSIATSTGSMAEREGAFGDDPFVDHRCPECGTPWPETVVEGTGIHIHGAEDPEGTTSERPLRYAYLNASFESGFENPIDERSRAVSEHDDLPDGG